MTQVLAIDPGPEMSAWCHYDATTRELLAFMEEPNTALLRTLAEGVGVGIPLVLETMCCMGQRVGKDTFRTAIWIGRFQQAWHSIGGTFHTVERPDIKLALCHSRAADDTMVRHALAQYFGFDTPRQAKGTKKQPGPLYGVANHIWSALAVAVTWADQQKEEK